MAKKGKVKHARCCYNCKYRWSTCKSTFKTTICDKFVFDSVSKST